MVAGRRQPGAAARGGYRRRVRYRFVDCRWSLDDPGWGRTRYLDGHIPGAVVPRRRARPRRAAGPGGRHPLPERGRLRPRRRGGRDRGRRVRRRLRLARRGRAALVAAPALRPRRLRGDRPRRLARTARAPARSGRARDVRAARARRRHDRASTSSPRAARSSSSSTRGSPRAGAARRTRSTAVPGRIPGALNAPWNEPLPDAARRASSSPTAARASRPASRCTASTSPAARDASIPARGRSGSSTTSCRASAARHAAADAASRTRARYRSQRCGIFGVASRMKSTGAGGRGGWCSSICTSCGKPVALAQVARRARGDDVLPHRLAAARARDHVVERQPAAGRAAVDAAPAVTREERAARDLALDDPRNADVVEEPDHVWPRELRRGRAKWSPELFDDLRLPLEHEHVRTSQRADVERLVTRVQDENLLHRVRKVPEHAARSGRRLASRGASGPSPVRRPPAPRARARPTACRGRAPSCRCGRSRGPGSR